MDCNPPGFSVHEFLQARILEWVPISSSRGSSRSRNWTCISCIGRWILYHWATSEVSSKSIGNTYSKQIQPSSFIFYKKCPSLIKHLAFLSTIPAEKWCLMHCGLEHGWGISLQEKDSMKIATWDWLTKLSEMEAPKQLQSPKVGLGARNGGLIWGESLVPFAQRTHKGEMSIPVRSARCFCGADWLCDLR